MYQIVDNNSSEIPPTNNAQDVSEHAELAMEPIAITVSHAEAPTMSSMKENAYQYAHLRLTTIMDNASHAKNLARHAPMLMVVTHVSADS